MNNRTKIGRNDYCPCGSGFKYKRCHLLKPNEPLPKKVPLPVLKELRRKKNAMQAEERIQKKLYGEVRPIIGCDTPWGKLVAIGSTIYKTAIEVDFHDVLLEHLLYLIDENWLKSELSKNETSNFLLKWCKNTFCNIEETKRLQKLHGKKRNLSFRPLLSLAYDLFVLSDHMVLQDRILKRLKYHDFSSARYEVFVAATCIRAGFKLTFENEDDRRQRHVEFHATHKDTGAEILVEAKRSGTYKHNYGKLINDALGKAGNYPLVVFVDVNKSPEVAKNYLRLDNPKLKRLLSSHIQKSDDNKDVYSLLVFTNHPYEYATQEEPYPERSSLIVEAVNPRIKPTDEKIMARLKKAIMQYGNIPNNFPTDI